MFEKAFAHLFPHEQLLREAKIWFARERSRQEPPNPNPQTIRASVEMQGRAAEAAAAARGVPAGSLFATTWLLMVEASWWSCPAAGWLIYSPAVRDDDSLFRDLLERTFASSISLGA